MHIPALRGVRTGLHAIVRDDTERHARRSAIVFAPHQDDETLGCGGTIILKRETGRHVSCVFMTDGATSHAHLIDPTQLRQTRRSEAIEALSLLGVHERHVRFLDFPDSRLSDCHDEAAGQVATLIQKMEPEEIYVPYADDGTPDHEATHRIVTDAVDRLGVAAVILEYPVWAWNTWPWVQLQVTPGREVIGSIRRMIRAGAGLRIASGFRTGVCVRRVLERKRAALSRHRSQMVAPADRPAWPTLGDVSNGDFLDCFFGDFEVFRERSSRR